MSTNQRLIVPHTQADALRLQLHTVCQNENLQEQKTLLVKLAADLAVNTDDLGAALLYILQQQADATACSGQNLPPQLELPSGTGGNVGLQVLETARSSSFILPPIKMVRYRLDIGKKHQITVKELKKVLVEESGVDKNNINNVMIHSQYTLIELPDEMPQDVFVHLKTVEINQQKLNIKRLKTRTKKTGNRFRRIKPRLSQLGEATD